MLLPETNLNERGVLLESSVTFVSRLHLSFGQQAADVPFRFLFYNKIRQKASGWER